LQNAKVYQAVAYKLLSYRRIRRKIREKQTEKRRMITDVIAPNEF